MKSNTQLLIELYENPYALTNQLQLITENDLKETSSFPNSVGFLIRHIDVELFCKTYLGQQILK
jgi:hypothetical protein